MTKPNLLFRYFVHPRTPIAESRVRVVLSNLAPDVDQTARSLEVYFETVEPAYLVTAAVLDELATVPEAQAVDAYYQQYGDVIRPLPAFAKKVRLLRIQSV